MNTAQSLYARLAELLSGRLPEGLALFLIRLAVAGVFWRSYLTKVEEGTWFQLSDITYFLFENEFTGVPLPVSVAAPLATYAEFLFPILLVLGLATRFSALALMMMTWVIQLFVFPTADHFFGWAIGIIGMTAILVSRGGGVFSLDALLSRGLKGQTSASSLGQTTAETPATQAS